MKTLVRSIRTKVFAHPLISIRRNIYLIIVIPEFGSRCSARHAMYVDCETDFSVSIGICPDRAWWSRFSNRDDSARDWGARHSVDDTKPKSDSLRPDRICDTFRIPYSEAKDNASDTSENRNPLPACEPHRFEPSVASGRVGPRMSYWHGELTLWMYAIAHRFEKMVPRNRSSGAVVLLRDLQKSGKSNHEDSLVHSTSSSGTDLSSLC